MPPHHQGDDSRPEPSTIPGAASRVSVALIDSLPPGFIMLCALNAIFLGTVLWFETRQSESRMALAMKLLEACPALAHESK